MLRIQHLIGGMIVFLVLENVINLIFFTDFNNNGFISKSFLALMVVANAARNSLSFFMLLLLCLGYGVLLF